MNSLSEKRQEPDFMWEFRPDTFRLVIPSGGTGRDRSSPDLLHDVHLKADGHFSETREEFIKNVINETTSSLFSRFEFCFMTGRVLPSLSSCSPVIYSLVKVDPSL